MCEPFLSEPDTAFIMQPPAGECNPYAFVKLGINPGMGAEYLLHRLVGPGRVVRRNIAAAASDPVDRILEQEARNQAPIFTDPAFQAKVKKMIEKLGTGEDA